MPAITDAPSAQPREPIPFLIAWATHVLTASGAVLAFAAFLAVEQQRSRLALVWLGVALIVDGIDGPLARWSGVEWRTPKIDGTTLDLVVDYLTYVFVPAILIYRADLLPPSWAPVAVGAILIASLYTFSRTDMKTADKFFLGFPALWNVVAFYLFMLQPAPWIGVGVIALFVLLTFAPLHFVHPIRVKRFQPWLAGLTALWGAASLPLLSQHWTAPWRETLLALSLTCVAALLALGALRTMRGP